MLTLGLQLGGVMMPCVRFSWIVWALCLVAYGVTVACGGFGTCPGRRVSTDSRWSGCRWTEGAGGLRYKTDPLSSCTRHQVRYVRIDEHPCGSYISYSLLLRSKDRPLATVTECAHYYTAMKFQRIPDTILFLRSCVFLLVLFARS